MLTRTCNVRVPPSLLAGARGAGAGFLTWRKPRRNATSRKAESGGEAGTLNESSSPPPTVEGKRELVSTVLSSLAKGGIALGVARLYFVDRSRWFAGWWVSFCFLAKHIAPKSACNVPVSLELLRSSAGWNCQQPVLSGGGRLGVTKHLYTSSS